MNRLVVTALAFIFVLVVSHIGLSTPARADIDIAVVGPLTGQYASFGDQFKAGAEMAQEDINAAGGVLGQKTQCHAQRRRLRSKTSGRGGQQARERRRELRRRTFLL